MMIVLLDGPGEGTQVERSDCPEFLFWVPEQAISFDVEPCDLGYFLSGHTYLNAAAEVSPAKQLPELGGWPYRHWDDCLCQKEEDGDVG